MKLDYTLSRNFQEMFLSEIETLQVQSLALAVLKKSHVKCLLI